MSGMMNNFYYGKAGQADFTPEQLPANRVQLFFSMFRIRFSGLIGMNLLYLLFALPAILWTIFNLMATDALRLIGAASALFGRQGAVSGWIKKYKDTHDKED